MAVPHAVIDAITVANSVLKIIFVLGFHSLLVIAPNYRVARACSEGSCWWL